MLNNMPRNYRRRGGAEPKLALEACRRAPNCEVYITPNGPGIRFEKRMGLSTRTAGAEEVTTHVVDGNKHIDSGSRGASGSTSRIKSGETKPKWRKWLVLARISAVTLERTKAKHCD